MPIKIKGLENLNVNREFEMREQAYIDAKKREIVDRLREATPKDTGEASEGWVVTPTGIENPVSHIDQLNRGSSQQAPSHFIERTLLEIEGVRLEGDAVKKK